MIQKVRRSDSDLSYQDTPSSIPNCSLYFSSWDVNPANPISIRFLQTIKTEQKNRHRLLVGPSPKGHPTKDSSGGQPSFEH